MTSPHCSHSFDDQEVSRASLSPRMALEEAGGNESEMDCIMC